MKMNAKSGIHDIRAIIKKFNDEIITMKDQAEQLKNANNG